LTSRLEKAAFLMLMRPIRTLGTDHYQVGSEDGLRHYEVLNGHCECSDYLRHGAGHPCKHRLALAFHQQLNEAEKPINRNGDQLSNIGTNRITAWVSEVALYADGRALQQYHVEYWTSQVP